VPLFFWHKEESANQGESK